MLRLAEAVELYGHQWVTVSKHVGGGKSAEQCRMRNRVRVGSPPMASKGRERVVNKQARHCF
jgi:hypothetical protein